ncbi:MAG TPA: DUF1206 domain-containing protein [Actinomycetota bacterium]|nr:DUF1206 domain-containing protein [Actinomycetota bacterium]
MRGASGPKQTAERWVRALARFGLACRGVVYFATALLAAEIAAGRPSGPADTSGALQSIGRQPLGRLLVIGIVVGFGALGALEAMIASRSWKSAADRLVAAGKALVYAGLAGTAVAVALHVPVRGGNREVVDVTARVMQAAGGRLLVGATGLGIGIAGVVLFVKGLRKSYDREVDLGSASPGTRRIVETLGVVGMTARGAIFALAGSFVVQAAVTFDPRDAKGIDGVLKSLAAEPFGSLLLALTAGGLAAFGVFSLIEVRYART